MSNTKCDRKELFGACALYKGLDECKECERNFEKDVLEKQIPKEPLDFGDESYLCPCCKRNNFYKGEYLDKQNYCDYCGQSIKWE